MAFEWNTCSVRPAVRRAQAQRYTESRCAEVQQRAELLLNLGFDKKVTTARIQRDVEWEYELGTLPAYHKQIKKLVEDVYKRRTLPKI